jgi:hypothetical protein
MGAIRQQRTLIAWIAIVALLGNVVAGLFCASTGPVAVDDPSSLLGVLCTSHGEDTAPNDGGMQPPPTKPCQICITVASFVLVYALVALALLMPLPVSLRNAFPSLPPLLSAIRSGALGSRAPPLPV